MPQNCGSHAPEDTFSFASSSNAPKNPPSYRGRRPFRTLPTLPLATRAVSPSTVPLLLLLRLWPLDCAFCNIGHLGLGAVLWNATRCSLLSLHALSPALRSLSTVHFSIPPTEILNLTCSFPFLEDLKLVVDFDGRPNGWSLPSTSPELTGILQLAVGSRYRTRPTECYLLDLPGSLHFSKVLLDRPVEDAELMTIRIHPRRRTISLCVSSTTYGSPILHPYP